MNMLAKLNIYLDYNNYYTINRAMRILKREFDIAERQLNSLHAQEVIRIAQHIHDTLCNTKSDNVWFQGVMAKKIRNLVGWMMKKNKSGGGGINGKDIE